MQYTDRAKIFFEYKLQMFAEWFSKTVATNQVSSWHTDLEAVGKKIPAMRPYPPSNLLISGLEFIEKQIFWSCPFF